MHTRAPRVQRQEWLLLLAVLAVGCGIRLIGVTQPFVDHWSWRQADVAMIAENFYRHGFNTLYPQINWAGSAPGYVGAEFQLVSIIAALLYIPFGVHAWIGRIVSVLFFVMSLPFFYFLVRNVANESSALYATVMYTLAPLSIFASRSFMPDMASLCFSIAALYLFAEWLRRERPTRLFVVTSLATSLAILIKLPSIAIGLPLSYLAWKKYGIRFLLQRELWVFAALSLIFPLAWYFHAFRTSTLYFPYHFFGEGGMTIESWAWYGGLLHRIVTSSLTPIVFAGMIVGSFLVPRTPLCHVFHWWLIANIFFIVVAGWGNRHEWYQLPLVPIAAALAGTACAFIWDRLQALTDGKIMPVFSGIIFWAALAYLSYTAVAPLYQHQRPTLWQVGNELSRMTPADALVVIADDGDPRAIYYSRRKGWHFLQDGTLKGYPADTQEAIAVLERFRSAGASYLAFPQEAFQWFNTYMGLREYLDLRYRRARDTPEYVIYDLSAIKSD